jgi:hypothetical protein
MAGGQGAGAVQPPLDGAHWNVERRGDLVIGQLAERVEEQRLPMFAPHLGEGAGQRTLGLRVEPCIGRRRSRHGILTGARVGPQHLRLAAIVAAQEIRGDSEQPRAGVLASRPERGGAAEGDLERLAHDVLGLRRPDASRDEPMHRQVVPRDQRLERPRIALGGRRQQDGIGIGRAHTP